MRGFVILANCEFHLICKLYRTCFTGFNIQSIFVFEQFSMFQKYKNHFIKEKKYVWKIIIALKSIWWWKLTFFICWDGKSQPYHFSPYKPTQLLKSCYSTQNDNNILLHIFTWFYVLFL